MRVDAGAGADSAPSAHVLVDATDSEPVRAYIENPDKDYRTTRAQRVAGLRYYDRNRERLLEQARVRRREAARTGENRYGEGHQPH